MTAEKKPAGPGRRAQDGATGVSNTTIALMPYQKAWLKATGGSAWVRAQIDAAIALEPPKKKRASKARS